MLAHEFSLAQTASVPSGLPFDRPIAGAPASGPKRALVQEVTGQLVWSPERAIQQRSREGVWVSPPEGAIWMPPLTTHKVRSLGEFFRFQLTPDVCKELPARACIAPVSPALRDVMIATLSACMREQDTSALVPIFVRELRDSGLPPLEDPYPVHADAAFLSRCAMHDGTPPRSLAGWARVAGIASAELSRQLEADTGMSFAAWQRQERLLRGVQLLAAGHSVAEAGRLAGYRSTAHWITLFKETTGTTPGRYFAPLVRAALSAAPANDAPPRATPGVQADGESLPTSHGFRVSLSNPEEGRRTRIHHHRDGELLWPSRVSSLTTDAGTWVGHERLALWVPPGVPHEGQEWGGRMRIYSIRHALCARLPDHPCPLRVTPELARALTELIPSSELRPRDAAAEAFLNGAREQIIPALPLRLLRAERTRELVEALRVDPSVHWPQERWAEQLGVSRSTLARACEEELGMPFGKLRRIMQIRRAVEHLTLGSNVREAAGLVGFTHVPKFIAMFRRHVGTTPAHYVSISRGA